MYVPFVAVLVQNNLAYMATSHLDGPTYQIICQSKILITALLVVAILGRSLTWKQWVSLGVLTLGVGLVQLSGSDSGNKASDGIKQMAQWCRQCTNLSAGGNSVIRMPVKCIFLRRLPPAECARVCHKQKIDEHRRAVGVCLVLCTIIIK